jgi:4-deoxy-L-threo-5-hexosulose-uronate ketol-isomerase
MDIREASHPNEFKSYSTDRIRQEFLIQDMFVPGKVKLVYSLYDRMIAGENQIFSDMDAVDMEELQ